MKIYVGNLPKQITDVQLHEMASAFGKPDSACIARFLVGGASKGFGFIEYRTAGEARAAIAGLDKKVVFGETLKVREASSLKPLLWSRAARL